MANQSGELFEKVVINDFCIGCGVCAGVCPRAYISMGIAQSGIYTPSISQKCELENCNLCVTSCPFWNQEQNEDTIAGQQFAGNKNVLHDPAIGYFLNTYVGYSKVDSHRINGASGGLTTWLLEQLLTNHQVDYVVCVAPVSQADVFFRFAIVSDIEELRISSRSCYYPVNLEQVLKFISKTPGNYAITGLPCYIKAIRLAMLRHKQIASRIKFLIGLVCGQMQNRYFVDYVNLMAGGDPTKIQEVVFRIKDENRPASDYGMRFLSDDPGINKTVYSTEGSGKAWLLGYFRPEACNYCDDIFAEAADIAFMDAWLPEYKQDYRGTNLVIARNQEIDEIIQNGARSGAIELSEIDKAKVIRSQKDVINKKRVELAYRLFNVRNKEYIPKKRVQPDKSYSLTEKVLYQLKENVRLAGKKAIDRPGGSIYQRIEHDTILPKRALKIATDLSHGKLPTLKRSKGKHG